MRTHIFACNESVLWSSLPIFCGQSQIVIYNRATYHSLVFVHKKIDASPIFGVSRINGQFMHCSRDGKIGLFSIFLHSNTNRWYSAQLHNKMPDCLRNMGVELPLFRIFHANTCWRKTHPILWCIFCAHGFA